MPDVLDLEREEAAGQAVRAAFAPLSAAEKTRVRARLMAAVVATPTARRWRTTVTRAVVALATVTSVMGGTAYASARSLPGDALYGLKRAAENAAVSVIPAGAVRDRILRRYARRRAAEVQELLEQGASPSRVASARSALRAAQRDAGLRPAPPASVPPTAGLPGNRSPVAPLTPPGLSPSHPGTTPPAGSKRAEPAPDKSTPGRVAPPPPATTPNEQSVPSTPKPDRSAPKEKPAEQSSQDGPVIQQNGETPSGRGDTMPSRSQMPTQSVRD